MSWSERLAEDYGLGRSHIESFETLLGLLVEQSDRNLTAVTSPAAIVNVHFRDSLSLLANGHVQSASNAIDVGSGAGFPGIPLAIVRSDLRVVMLEANKRKCAFIQRAVDSLGLDNASVLHGRAEDAARTDLRDAFDVAFARAVGPISVTLEYTLPFVKPGGHAVLQRGSTLAGDKEAAEAAATVLNATLELIMPVHPYPGARNLHLWEFEKKAATPDRYPRKAGLAKKRPLK